MKPVTANTAVIFALGAFSAYWILASFVPMPILIELFNNLSFGVAATVVATWSPAAYYAFRNGAKEGAWQLVIAIFLAFLVLVYQRIFAIVNTSFGPHPGWLLGTALHGFIPYSITIIGVLFLVAPGTSDPARSMRHWVHVLVGVGIGGLMAGIVIGSTFF